jgi:hypothetical protein
MSDPSLVDGVLIEGRMDRSDEELWKHLPGNIVL